MISINDEVVNGKLKMKRWNIKDISADRVTETLFLVLSGIYISYISFSQTTLNFNIPAGFEKILFAVMTVVCLIRMALRARSRAVSGDVMQGSTAADEKGGITYRDIPFWACLACVMVYVCAYRSEGYMFLLFLAVMTAGFMDISWRRVLGMYLCCTFLTTVSVFLLSFAGVTDNLVYVGIERIRSSWGICYPTDCATIVFMIIAAAYILMRNKYADLIIIPFTVLYIVFTRVITDSVTGTVTGALFLAAVLLRIAGHLIIDVSGKCAWIRKVSGAVTAAAFPVCAAFMLFFVWAYHKGYDFAVIASNTLHGRPETGAMAYERYGLTAFGTPYEQIGGGGTVLHNIDYFFVDSTYPLVLIRYGAVTLFMFMLLWVYLTVRALKSGNRRMAAVLMIIAVHSLSEHHFPEVNYNIFLAMPFVCLETGEQKEKAAAAVPGYCYAASAAVFAVIVAALFPWGVSRARTLASIYGLTGGGNKAAPVFAAAVFAICALAVLVRDTAHIAYRFVSRIKEIGTKDADTGSRVSDLQVKGCVVRMGVILAILVLAFLHSEKIVRLGMQYRAADMEADRQILETVTDAAEGKVYVTDVPEVYRRSFKGISDSYLVGEDLGRFGNTTVITDKNGESVPFTGSGFLYAGLSEHHDLYTNDRPVIEALMEMGVHVTGYYSALKSADMIWMAGINGLALTDHAEAILEGPEHSMPGGPYVDLYSGKYTVIWKLHKDSETAAPDHEICTLKVNAYWGKQVLRQIQVYANQFDENGDIEVTAVIWIGGCRAVEFPVFAAEGERLLVKEITWQKTPDQDTHVIYDGNRRRIREENYDILGAPVLGSGGYFAMDLGYDDMGNISERVYTGTDGEPVMISAGYAAIEDTYNAKKQLICQKYFDTEGAPAVMGAGYSMAKWEYDRRRNPVKISYFDGEGEPVMTTWGYSAIERDYDSDRRITRESYFGTDGEAVPLPSGQYGVRYEYDDRDNISRYTYLNADGEPVKINSGYAILIRDYNDAKQVIREAYRDTDGEPVVMGGGYSELRREYDGAGRVRRESYYDGNGEPAYNTSGVFAWDRTYNDKGDVLAEEYYDTDLSPVSCTGGYASFRRTFNDKRQIIHEEYYDPQGEKVTCTGGYYGYDREYDEAGNIIKQVWVDTGGKPMYNTSRYAWWCRIYDANKDPVEEAYYNLDGEPVRNSSGIFRIMRTYDDRHRNICEKYYDTDNQKCCNNSGVHELRREYNDKNQTVRESYFGLDGEPVLIGECYSSITYDYNEDGTTQSLSYMDPEENVTANASGVASVEYGYGDGRYRTLERYLDVSGKVVKNNIGIAGIRREYDRRWSAREYYFGEEDEKVLRDAGFHGIEREYDIYGNVIKITYVDTEKRPVMTNWGYAVTERHYDEARNCTDEYFYDTEGNPSPTGSGFIEIHRKFGPERQVLETENVSPPDKE